MTPEVLPAMLSLRKLRHHERDVLSLFFPDDRDLIIQVKTLPDRKYSATWRGWYLPNTALHRRSVQKLGKLESFSLDYLASLSGTIAAIPASDDHTGISSQEELSASASIRGRTEAADIQETGKDQLKITFSGNQFFIKLFYDPADVTNKALSLIQSPLDQRNLFHRFPKKTQE